MSEPCFNCGAPSSHQHHVVPRSLGGVATVPLCYACHGKAHGRSRGFRDTSELTSKALADLKASGVRLGGAPFGWEYSDRIDSEGRRILVPVLHQQAIRNRILALHAAGRSLRVIAAVLNQDGATPQPGARWHAVTVNRIVRAVVVPEGDHAKPPPVRASEPPEVDAPPQRGLFDAAVTA